MGIGSFFGKLFGGEAGSSAPEPAETVVYQGYQITAAPIKEGGQYKTAGTIAKELGGELRSASFIRADNHADRESAVSHTERKARQIIDEQGDSMFDRTHI